MLLLISETFYQCPGIRVNVEWVRSDFGVEVVGAKHSRSGSEHITFNRITSKLNSSILVTALDQCNLKLSGVNSSFNYVLKVDFVIHVRLEHRALYKTCERQVICRLSGLD